MNRHAFVPQFNDDELWHSIFKMFISRSDVTTFLKTSLAEVRVCIHRRAALLIIVGARYGSASHLVFNISAKKSQFPHRTLE